MRSLLIATMVALVGCSSPLPPPVTIDQAEATREAIAKVVEAAKAALPEVDRLRGLMVQAGALPLEDDAEVKLLLARVGDGIVRLDQGYEMTREEAKKLLADAEAARDVLERHGARMPALVESALSLARLVVEQQ